MTSRDVAPKKVLEMMREATGASEEDICVMLQLCHGDANEATEKLLENPFARVESKKDKRLKAEEQRRKEAELQRRSSVDSRRAAPAMRGRGRGELGRAGRGTGRGLGRGVTGGYASAAPASSNGAAWEDSGTSEGWGAAATTTTGLAEQQAVPSETGEGWGAAAPAATDEWGDAAAPVPSVAAASATKEGVSFASLLRSKTEAVAAATPGGAQPAANSGEAVAPPMHEVATTPGEVGTSPPSSWPDSAPPPMEVAQPAAMDAEGPVELAPIPAASTAPSALQPALYGQASEAAAGPPQASTLYAPVAAGTASAGEVEGLQLTFGNFTLNSPGMGEFGAGFGSGFGGSDAAPASSASTGDIFGGSNAAAATAGGAPPSATSSVPAATSADGYKAPSTSYGYGGVVAASADPPSHVGAASSGGARGYGGLQTYVGLEGFASGTRAPPSTSYGDAFGNAYGHDSLKGAAAGYASSTAAKYGSPAAAGSHSMAAVGQADAATATSSALAAVAAPGNMAQLPYGAQYGYAQYPAQMYNMYANPYGYNPYAANPYAASAHPAGQGGFPPQATRYNYNATASSAQGPAGGYDDSPVPVTYSTYGNYVPGAAEKDGSGNLYSAYGQQQPKQQPYQGYQGYNAPYYSR